MLRRSLALILVVAVAIAAYWWWRAQPSRAEQLAKQAATPEQTRLWQDVARRGTSSPGLDRLPMVSAVDVRRAPAPPSSAQTALGRESLAPGVESGIRVIGSSGPPGAPFAVQPFSGMARVAEVDVDNERITLNLGGSTLVIAARIANKPLSVAKDDTVEVAFESRADVFERREIFALRTVSGALVATAMESGEKTVTLEVGPPLNLTARQKNEKPVNGALPVDITIGKTTVTMTPGGPTATIEGVSVTLLGSVALPVSGAGDGSPYAIDLVAWRQPGK